ncbi:hypothetical protein DNTS_001532 [Danionella cerebrum]|uniref:Rab-GAP TBC domain-containing protein n=1 Tax=Danionella cerebrum TaxID=2873325 RepID=A0A553PZ28_9TELE|nr:hypothetical protein DNTS_001532 [Danionella translucida]
MYNYGLRELYKNNFEDLHCKFYQLERLLQEQLPDLWNHFQGLNLEAHMYASQWFLTLFTAKFPLCMVFHITDLLLSEGLNIIFNVALALLKAPKPPPLFISSLSLLYASLHRHAAASPSQRPSYLHLLLPLHHSATFSSIDSISVGVSLMTCQRWAGKHNREAARAGGNVWKPEDLLSIVCLDSTMRLCLLLSNRFKFRSLGGAGPTLSQIGSSSEVTVADCTSSAEPPREEDAADSGGDHEAHSPLTPERDLPSPLWGQIPPATRRLGDDNAGEDKPGALNDCTDRVMGLLGMGHRLFVPRLLATSKEDLLQADFEGALKFFRVQLPKRYRAAENARRLMEQACNIKVNL